MHVACVRHTAYAEVSAYIRIPTYMGHSPLYKDIRDIGIISAATEWAEIPEIPENPADRRSDHLVRSQVVTPARARRAGHRGKRGVNTSRLVALRLGQARGAAGCRDLAYVEIGICCRSGIMVIRLAGQIHLISRTAAWYPVLFRVFRVPDVSASDLPPGMSG